ncbi:Hypothetical predicted protein, partial [Olea europaea subsp. europaea]
MGIWILETGRTRGRVAEAANDDELVSSQSAAGSQQRSQFDMCGVFRRRDDGEEKEGEILG